MRSHILRSRTKQFLRSYRLNIRRLRRNRLCRSFAINCSSRRRYMIDKNWWLLRYRWHMVKYKLNRYLSRSLARFQQGSSSCILQLLRLITKGQHNWCKYLPLRGHLMSKESGQYKYCSCFRKLNRNLWYGCCIYANNQNFRISRFWVSRCRRLLPQIQQFE